MITYYTKEGKFETDVYAFIPFTKLYNENGPVIIIDEPDYYCCEWWLNGKEYFFENWLKYHPNQEQSFQALMKLKYK